MEAVHLVTEKENIADIVLLPGDPLRAKYIAENFLEDAKLVNTIRNMFAFTGTYKGKRITVMGSGMGMPSMGIYAYELYHLYDVKKIIRIGTAGSNNPKIKLGDVVLATGAYTVSNFAFSYSNEERHFEKATPSLVNVIEETAKENNIDIVKGPIMTTDIFDVYVDAEHIKKACPINDEILAKEMESFALFHIARIEGKEADALISVVDSEFDDNMITPEDRETKLNKMITLALESIIK